VGSKSAIPLLSKETWECLGPALAAIEENVFAMAGSNQIFDFEVKILNDFTDRLGRSNVNHDRNEELAVNPGVLDRVGSGPHSSERHRLELAARAGLESLSGIRLSDQAWSAIRITLVQLVNLLSAWNPLVETNEPTDQPIIPMIEEYPKPA